MLDTSEVQAQISVDLGAKKSMGNNEKKVNRANFFKEVTESLATVPVNSIDPYLNVTDNRYS